MARLTNEDDGPTLLGAVDFSSLFLVDYDDQYESDEM